MDPSSTIPWVRLVPYSLHSDEPTTEGVEGDQQPSVEGNELTTESVEGDEPTTTRREC